LGKTTSAIASSCQIPNSASTQLKSSPRFALVSKQGRIADRSHEAQQFRASGLNLVIASIIYWNSTYIADAVKHLRDMGEPVPSELLAHTSPVGWGHIAFSGDFLWDRAAASVPAERRPLNVPRPRLAA
jgi:hypothetical protein